MPNVRFSGWRKRKSGNSARSMRLRSTFENATSTLAFPRKPQARAFSADRGMRARVWMLQALAAAPTDDRVGVATGLALPDRGKGWRAHRKVGTGLGVSAVVLAW